jgi:hypothetical protein
MPSKAATDATINRTRILCHAGKEIGRGILPFGEQVNPKPPPTAVPSLLPVITWLSDRCDEEVLYAAA